VSKIYNSFGFQIDIVPVIRRIQIMRKIIVIEYITLDGVTQGPGGPEAGFAFGGWSAPYYDEALDAIANKYQHPAKDLLLGRTTYDIFAEFWPEHAGMWPGIDDATKYVMSDKPLKSKWNNTVVLKNVDELKKIKDADGPAIQVSGSSKMVQTLLEHDLVDEIVLMIHPLTLGTGRKLFAEGTMPAAFKLVESATTPSGVIVADYKRDGDVKTGSMGS